MIPTLKKEISKQKAQKGPSREGLFFYLGKIKSDAT